MVTITGFFHDITDEALSSVSIIFTPTLFKLLCTVYLMELLHISMFNWCYPNSFYMECIFYYRILIQLHRCLLFTHNRCALVYDFYKNISLIRIVTYCYRYLQPIDIILIQFLFCDFSGSEITVDWIISKVLSVNWIS